MFYNSEGKRATGPGDQHIPWGGQIALVVFLVLLGFVAGSAVRELTQYDVAGVGAAIGVPAIIALFGMFWIAQSWKDALTAALVVTYLIFLAGILAIFVFPAQQLPLEGGAKVIVDNFTSLVLVVVTAYLGTEAVETAAKAYRSANSSQANAQLVTSLQQAGFDKDAIKAVLERQMD